MIIVTNQMKAAATSVTGNGGRRSMSGQIALSMVCHPISPPPLPITILSSIFLGLSVSVEVN